MVNPKNIDSIIDRRGSTVIILEKGDITYNDWGDESSDTSSSTSTVAVVNDITGQEEFNKDGIFVPGDKIFFFKSTEIELNNQNTISFNDSIYNIRQVVSHNFEDNVQQYEVRGKKIS